MADWRQVLRAAARKYNLDPSLAEAQIGQESNFNPNARSPAGAEGIAQIMPDTARGWGVDPMDPYAALNAYAKNMSQYVHKYGTRGALIAYNAGPGAVGRSNLPSETVDYINKIMGAAGHATSPSSPAYNAAVRRATGGPLQASSPSTPNLFTQMGQATPVNVIGTNPQLQELQQTTAKNYQLMGSIQDALMNAANRRTAGNAQGTSDFDTSFTPVPTGDKGTADFEGKTVAGWIAPILAYARSQGWKGSVNSGYRSFADQTRIYNSGVRPAAKPGTSNHEGSEFPRGAVDVSEAAQLSEILRRSKYAKLLQWAGDKDPVHFSHPHNGSY